MLRIEYPLIRSHEHRYILHVILEDFLGLPCHMEERDTHKITIRGEDGYTLTLPSLFLCMNESLWMKEPSLAKIAFAERHGVAVLFGETAECRHEGKNSCIDLDIFGASFFMLTRYEEAVQADKKDKHGRFPAEDSFGVKYGFIQRPLVNEYLEILWSHMKEIWPQLSRKRREFCILPTHDVDAPFYWQKMKFRNATRLASSQILKRKSPEEAYRTARAWIFAKAGIHRDDPYNTFFRLMDVTEKSGHRSAFYFVPNGKHKAYDPTYRIRQNSIRALIRNIASRGHEIGLHSSYNTYDNQPLLEQELRILKKTCSALGVYQEEWGGRHHYLRWSGPQAYGHWARAGLSYDSSVGFAGQAGFRCGTCYDFPTYDLFGRKQLSLRERPLIAMERSFLSPEYMNLKDKPEQIAAAIDGLKAHCRHYKGNFVLLWHNSALTEEWHWDLYKQAIAA